MSEAFLRASSSLIEDQGLVVTVIHYHNINRADKKKDSRWGWKEEMDREDPEGSWPRVKAGRRVLWEGEAEDEDLRGDLRLVL